MPGRFISFGELVKAIFKLNSVSGADFNELDAHAIARLVCDAGDGRKLGPGIRNPQPNPGAYLEPRICFDKATVQTQGAHHRDDYLAGLVRQFSGTAEVKSGRPARSAEKTWLLLNHLRVRAECQSQISILTSSFGRAPL